MATVEQWGPLRKHWLYQGRIRSVSVNGAPDHLRVEIVNLDPRELDRVHTVNLPLPAKPGNRTCALFVASGMDATEIGSQIQIDLIVGRHIGLRYRGQGTDGTEAFDFAKVSTTPADNADASTTTEKAIRPAQRD
jgi:hypothetical protein